MNTQKPLQLFAKQCTIYPKRVWGVFRKLKWLVMFITLGIYYITPFLRWDRGLHAPDQAILIDMPNRRAYFFMIEIWPQEVYYLTGLLILAAIALFFVTSLFGRVWCGYLCPQTVWTDLFVWVERIVQGDRNQRKKLDESPLSWNKIWRKATTHAIWILIAACTGGAWVLYFNDAPTLIEQIAHGHMSTAVAGWIAALTFSTYLMAGYAREQVCMYMCPYARFQSAMFDKDTLIISYDEKRGEPRGHHKQGESWENRGHCVDCTACVQVCPMGIDIRNGLQMECIACGLCIDACDNVMEKVGLPKGLIRYDTVHNQEARLEGRPEKKRIFRPRTFYYMAILAVVSSVMLWGLLSRAPAELHVLHDRNPLFVRLSDGEIRNGYDIKILNKTHDDQEFRIGVEGLDGASLRVQAAGEISNEAVPVFADSVGHIRAFITAAATSEVDKKNSDITIWIENRATGERVAQETLFVYQR